MHRRILVRALLSSVTLTGVTAAAVPVAAIAQAVVATSTSFTANTSTVVEQGRVVVLEAQLRDAAGLPLAGREVTFRFSLMTVTATTNALGVARVTLSTRGLSSGTYAASARFVGDATHQQSQAVTTVEVTPPTPPVDDEPGDQDSVDSGASDDSASEGSASEDSGSEGSASEDSADDHHGGKKSKKSKKAHKARGR